MKDKATEVARERYDRRAPTYDIMETFAERWRFSKWRRMLWDNVEGRNILEVGVGTGKNFPYYPASGPFLANPPHKSATNPTTARMTSLRTKTRR